MPVCESHSFAKSEVILELRIRKEMAHMVKRRKIIDEKYPY